MDKSGLRVFIIECPDPIDLLQKRSERHALENICGLFGHEVATFFVKSTNELKSVCNYIASIDEEQDEFEREKVPICIHISAHGNKRGLVFGNDTVTWKQLSKIISPINSKMYDYSGDVIFVISACEAKEQKLTLEFERERKQDIDFRPPIYLFVTAENSVYWKDAIVAWTIFYRRIPNVNLDDKGSVKSILNDIRDIGVGKVRYYRWDKNRKKYLSFTSKRRKKA